MYSLPGRKEILEQTPSGAITLLDSTLGEGYQLLIQGQRGIRWNGRGDDDPLFNIVEAPPMFPVRFLFAHIKGQSKGQVKVEVKVRGGFVECDEDLVMDGVAFSIHASHRAPWGTTLHLEIPLYVKTSMAEIEALFLQAITSSRKAVVSTAQTNIQGIELVAATSTDLAEVAQANIVLQAKIQRLQELQKEAERRIHLLALGVTPEDKRK